jgi:hypothetical protein
VQVGPRTPRRASRGPRGTGAREHEAAATTGSRSARVRWWSSSSRSAHAARDELASANLSTSTRLPGLRQAPDAARVQLGQQRVQALVARCSTLYSAASSTSRCRRSAARAPARACACARPRASSSRPRPRWTSSARSSRIGAHGHDHERTEVVALARLVAADQRALAGHGLVDDGAPPRPRVALGEELHPLPCTTSLPER